MIFWHNFNFRSNNNYNLRTESKISESRISGRDEYLIMIFLTNIMNITSRNEYLEFSNIWHHKKGYEAHKRRLQKIKGS
jgi:hypothetical protein